MKHYLYIFLLSAFCTFAFSFSAYADGEWTIYASYHNPVKAVKTNGLTFVLANGDLYSFDSEDSEIRVYDKSNVLSDFGIKDIAYCRSVKALVVLYKNGNIDVITEGDGCVNMPDLKMANVGKINELCISGKEAFVSTDLGLVCINLKDYFFGNTYKLAYTITSCLANSKVIYAKTNAGTYLGDRSLNLLNPKNWKLLTNAELSADATYKTLVNESKNDDEALAKAKKLIPDSPVRNYFYKLNMVGDRLLAAGGNFYFSGESYTGTAVKYENGRWSSFDEMSAIELVGADAFKDVTDIVQDPNEPEHHWLGTATSGIYEFRNYKLVKNYNCNNSSLTSILPNNKHPELFVRATGLEFDNSGNLWMCNNQVDTIVKILKPDGKWLKYYYSEVTGKPTWDHTVFDSRGWAWINCRRSTESLGDSGMLIINTNGTIDTQKDDKHRFITSFSNQDGTIYSPDLWYCATEDLEGAIWVGNTAGIFMTPTPENVFDNGFCFDQIKVPRNDGSSLADYLLSGVPVKCITVDGANRKWVGTLNNGVYLISADGLESIHHFTKSNSPLISDAINDIAINGTTGEVFIATDAGLCSFKSDAADPSETLESSSLSVYPNPVRPEYSGDVHITGLAFNSNVKIANAAGRLVYEGQSNGGMFTWNCCYRTGKKVSSGIYYALCTDEAGKKGACAKILIIK